MEMSTVTSVATHPAVCQLQQEYRRARLCHIAAAKKYLDRGSFVRFAVPHSEQYKGETDCISSTL